jgi:arylsulfatase A-like enzyme
MRTQLLLLAVLLTAACATAPPPEPSPAPSILLIVADDLGYGDLGAYGQEEIQTPHIDRLATQGIRFTNFYSGSTVCAPSRAALMTGLHTGHTAIRGNSRQPLPDASVTIAEALREVGYRTGMVGKWGLGELDSEGEPNRQGFDFFYGYLNQRHAHNYYPEHLIRNSDVEALDNVVPEPKDESGSGYATTRLDYSHDLMTEEALGFLDRNHDQPFFLTVTYTIPHANNQGGELGMEVPDLGIYANKPWPDPAKGHAAMISRMDSDIGRMMARLDELGITDDTIVLFTSDNGPHREGGNDPDFNDSNGPLRGIKRDLYEGGIRVPLIVRWPNHTPRAAVSDQVGAFWDFLPTFTELTGAPTPANLDGQSLLDSFDGTPSDSADRALYWEFHEGAASKQAVRRGQWKGVRLTPDGPLELYNLEHDLSEEHDVAASNPGVVEQLEQYLSTARTENDAWPLRYPE